MRPARRIETSFGARRRREPTAGRSRSPGRLYEKVTQGTMGCISRRNSPDRARLVPTQRRTMPATTSSRAGLFRATRRAPWAGCGKIVSASTLSLRQRLQGTASRPCPARRGRRLTTGRPPVFATRRAAKRQHQQRGTVRPTVRTGRRPPMNHAWPGREGGRPATGERCLPDFGKGLIAKRDSQ